MPVKIGGYCDYCNNRDTLTYVPQPNGLAEYRCSSCLYKPSRIIRNRNLFTIVLVIAGVAFWSWVAAWCIIKANS